MKKIHKNIISSILVLIIAISCVFMLSACFKSIGIEYVFMDNGVEFKRKSIKISTLVKSNTSTFESPSNDDCKEFAYWQVEEQYSDIVTISNNIVIKTETLTDGAIITFNSVYVDNHTWGLWVSKKEPTETVLGEKSRTCDKCSAQEETTYAFGDDLQAEINFDEIINKSNSDYGRTDISNSFNRTPTKINNMLSMYDSLERESRNWFKEGRNAIYDFTNGFYYIAIVDISDLNLSRNEMLEVYSAFLCDTHIYYFISKNIFYNIGYSGEDSMKNIALTVDKEYINGAIRKGINKTVTEYIMSFNDIVEREQYAYSKAIKIHDLMISNVSYDTPNKPWAHNILGVAGGNPEEGPVCESYAKTYNMLLNFYGIETIYVTGGAGKNFGEPHAWNLIKLDDDNWYWVDPTWNDTGDSPGTSMRHRYFAVGSISYSRDHKPTAPGLTVINNIVDYMYKLPTVSENNYSVSIDR